MDKKSADKRYYLAHREARLAYAHAWQTKNKEHYLAVARKTRALRRVEVLSHYGLKCNCCGETTIEFLCIDHIDGYTDGPRSGEALYNWLRKRNYPDGFQVLCHNCNNAKGIYGTCPHKRDYYGSV
jgi:hypothetical protein